MKSLIGCHRSCDWKNFNLNIFIAPPKKYFENYFDLHAVVSDPHLSHAYMTPG